MAYLLYTGRRHVSLYGTVFVLLKLRNGHKTGKMRTTVVKSARVEQEKILALQGVACRTQPAPREVIRTTVPGTLMAIMVHDSIGGWEELLRRFFHDARFCGVMHALYFLVMAEASLPVHVARGR